MKVAVVAVLKDEACYLSDWIHHYLYFGFEGIFIGVNRTSDSSSQILKKIADINPKVHAYNIDWLDQGTSDGFNRFMQQAGYAFLSQQVLSSKTSFTHVLYVDIDEFWFYKDFSKSINDFINSLPYKSFGAMSLNWCNQMGDSTEFELPFQNQGYTSSRLLKTMINVALIPRIVNFGAHAPRFSRPKRFRYIDANGDKFEQGQSLQFFKSVPDASAMILHRINRSEKEYLSVLTRKNPNSDCPFKINRKGFDLNYEKKLNIPENLLLSYWDSLENFKYRCNVNDDINLSRLDISTDKLIEIIESPKQIISNLDSFFIALKGTRFLSYELVESLYRRCEKMTTPENAEYYFKAARMLEIKGMFQSALLMIKLARKSKPNHRGILKKCNEIENKLKENGKPTA